ncbi:MAG TPA: NlpC/P60 family protein [Acidimicrobiia bacterium]|nr:NlpC/P60 family protein [Acidimicrobiia bacterium]
MKTRRTRIVSVLVLGLALTLLVPGYASGQPTQDIQAKAAQIERDLNAANDRVVALIPQLQAAEAQLADANTRVSSVQDNINSIKLLLNGRAAAFYKFAGAAGPFDALNAEDATDLSARSKYGDVAAGNDDSLVRQLAAQRTELDKARAAAQSERDGVAAAKAEADAAAGEQQKLLDQVKGQVEAEMRRQTADRATSSRSLLPVLGNGGAGAAAAFAQNQVGKPYCNTSERFGPNCFDCSGLTTSSWRAGGLDIPTTSGAQGSAFPHVDLGQLQPGDLITTSSWSAHVGIWVGGGYVHATSYRNNPNAVKFVAGTGSVVDAVRPH